MSARGRSAARVAPGRACMARALTPAATPRFARAYASSGEVGVAASAKRFAGPATRAQRTPIAPGVYAGRYASLGGAEGAPLRPGGQRDWADAACRL